MGNALYDIKGLTYQGHLHQFWQADFKPNMKLFKKFRGYLLVKTQVNWVFYGCFKYNINNGNNLFITQTMHTTQIKNH